MQRRDDRADEGRLSGAERASERDDVARPQRASEIARESLERSAIVEDVKRCLQNSVGCFCA
ncbi:MAG TPA: hypothetical protein VE826_10135 [Dongiaceae bacterium]|nr:hypothetical protein [Dongiaceae bacterium]